MTDLVIIGAMLGLGLIAFVLCEFLVSYFPEDDEAPR